MEILASLLGVLVIARLSDCVPLDEPACPIAWGAALFAFPAIFWGSKVLFPPRAGRGLFQIAARHAGLALFLGSYYSVLYPLGWARWALVDLRWRGRELVSLLLLLAPALGLALCAAPVIGRKSASLPDESLSGPGRRIAVAVRPLAAPLALLSAAAYLAGLCRSSAAIREALDLYRSLDVLLACAALLVIFAASPLLIRAAWPTRPFPPGALRERFADIARSLRVRLESVRVWESRSTSFLNACVVGLVPGTRQVIFTRGICERLEPEELSAVFAHEAAHAARHHLSWHFLLAAAFLLGIAPLDAALEPLGEAAAGAAIIVFAAAYWGVFFGVVSRRLEMEADLAGADAVGPAPYASGLRRVERLIGSSASRGGWRHFSLRSRRERIERAAADPAERDAILRAALRSRGAVLCVALASLAAFSWCAADELGREREVLAAEKAKLSLSLADDVRALLDASGSDSWLARSRESLEEELRAHLSRAEEHLAVSRSAASRDRS